MAKISDTDKEYLLSLKPEDLTFSLLVSLFGDTVTQGEGLKSIRKSRFNTNDEMTLTPKEYFVKEPTNTTIGRFIYNKYIVERVGLQNVLGYVNYAITEPKNSGIERRLATALIEDEITTDQFHMYIDYINNLGLQLNSVITSSYSPATIKADPAVIKRRDELFKKYDKELKAGDIIVSEKIEKELVAMAKEKLQGDTGMELYASGARGSFDKINCQNKTSLIAGNFWYNIRHTFYMYAC